MTIDMMNFKGVKSALYAAAFLAIAGMAHCAQEEDAALEGHAVVAGDTGAKKEKTGLLSKARNKVVDMKKSAAQRVAKSLPEPVVAAGQKVKGAAERAAGTAAVVGMFADAIFVAPLKCAIMKKKLEYTKEKLEEQSGHFNAASLKFKGMAVDAEKTLATLNEKCPSDKEATEKKGSKNIVCSLRTKLLEGKKASYTSLSQQSEEMKKAVDKQVEDIDHKIWDLQMQCSGED